MYDINKNKSVLFTLPFKINNRHLEFLKLCFDQYVISRPQAFRWIKIHYQLKNQNCLNVVFHRMIKTLKQIGLIEEYKELKGICQLYQVTKRAMVVLQSLCHVPQSFQNNSMDDSIIAHHAACTECRLVFEEMTNIEEWKTRRLLSAINYNNQVPDAAFTYINEEHQQLNKIAIVVELNLEDGNIYRKNFFQYYRSDDYITIFYFVAHKKIKDAIVKQLSEVTDKFYCGLIDDLVLLKQDAVIENPWAQIRLGEKFYR